MNIHAEWEGKILETCGQPWLILRQLQPAKAGYKYDVYKWQPPNSVTPSGAMKVKNDMKLIAQAMGIPLTCVSSKGGTVEKTTTQLGNEIWEKLSLL